MPTTSGVGRHIFLAMVLVFMFGGLACADWHIPIWEDDFSDGDFTGDPTWTTFSSGGFATWDATTGAFAMSGTYNSTYAAGWVGAYVDQKHGDQGLEGWVSPYSGAADGVAALALLRYTPGSVFGTGYALAITYNASDDMVAGMYQLNDATGNTLLGTERTVLEDSYDDMLFRFLVMGTGDDTNLMARVWADDGSEEPEDWLFDFTLSGAPYDDGFGGVGVVTQNPGVTEAEATFDNLQYGTPEPTTMVLLATGLGALALRRRRNA
ncbi:MAG: PEP-CTERM sorting domain-containing protein [Armatimonadota bacterium]